MNLPETIAHYRITSKLGEGGMGAVYRATDTKLSRDVAIKVIPDSFAADPDRLARFTREAQVLASLNHPNIAAIYGVEDRAIVMELVEGQTLAGPIPMAEALPLIHQLIDALEYAHEKGVVHRDLKPANIKVTPEGRLKVLDFGLAKALSSETPAADPTSSPTITMRATMSGVIMGTPGYMAPEQARGLNVDKRADIWAFGVVVYEILTGQQLFEGPTVSDTLAAVLTRDLDVTAVPPPAQRLIRLCLTRDARQRLRDIGDARLLLAEAPAAVAAPAPVPGRKNIWPIAAGVLGLIAAAAMWFALRSPRPPDRPALRLNVDLGPDAVAGNRTTAAISPDGKRLVYPARGASGTQQLAMQVLGDSKVTLLPGTEGAVDVFFSPDSQSIGFMNGTRLLRMAIEGGAPVTICDGANQRGASWGEDGTIVFGAGINTWLKRVPAAGGTPQDVSGSRASGEATHRWPQILPGGEWVLFTANKEPNGFEGATIAAISLKTGKRKDVLRGGYFARYLPSGHLVYAHQGSLFAVAFDADRLETRGTPVPVATDSAATPFSGGGQFDVSRTGTLVYLPGRSMDSAWPLVWIDSAGKTEPMLPTAGMYYWLSLSPDVRRLAFTGQTELSVYDIQRGSSLRLGSGPGILNPVWSPDGKHLVFTTGAAADYQSAIWWVRADGGNEPYRLISFPNAARAWSFSPDGRRLAIQLQREGATNDLATIALDLTDPERPKPGPVEPFLATAANETNPEFSRDGRWIAYEANDTGAREIYVRPFPGPGGKWQVSQGGATFAKWSRDGRRLFYQGIVESRIMTAGYTVQSDALVFDRPRVWSERRLLAMPGSRIYDLAPDGQRIIAAPRAETEQSKGSVHVTFVVNLFDELKRRLP